MIFFTVLIASITFPIRAHERAARVPFIAAFGAAVLQKEKSIQISQARPTVIHPILLKASHVLPL